MSAAYSVCNQHNLVRAQTAGSHFDGPRMHVDGIADQFSSHVITVHNGPKHAGFTLVEAALGIKCMGYMPEVTPQSCRGKLVSGISVTHGHYNAVGSQIGRHFHGIWQFWGHRNLLDPAF